MLVRLETDLEDLLGSRLYINRLGVSAMSTSVQDGSTVVATKERQPTVEILTDTTIEENVDLLRGHGFKVVSSYEGNLRVICIKGDGQAGFRAGDVAVQHGLHVSSVYMEWCFHNGKPLPHYEWSLIIDYKTINGMCHAFP